MTPVDQTIFGVGEGNCFSACIASLLNCPIEDVPNLNTEALDADGSHWMDRWKRWLETRGKGMVYIAHDGRWPHMSLPAGQHVILSGRSPRESTVDLFHAVIARVNAWQDKEAFAWDLEIVHDPYPTRDGIEKITSMIFLVDL